MKSIALALLRRFPKAKQVAKKIYHFLFPNRSVSQKYTLIHSENVSTEAQRLRGSWQSHAIPDKQRTLAEKELLTFRQGKPVAVMDVFVEALRGFSALPSTPSLLEVGCASGYYSEVLTIKGLPFIYTGCDYSSSLIELGKRYYPHLSLAVQDATCLGFSDEAFDVVVSGSCLLHIPDFPQAIAEASRVARRYVIFHRTVTVGGMPNQYYRKLAYGVETFEIHFNEQELLQQFHQCGLTLLRTLSIGDKKYGENAQQWEGISTFVCEKMKKSHEF